MYVRKTRDVYAIQIDYGYGFETEAEYDTRSEAERDIMEYRRLAVSYHGRCRIIKRRVKKD